MTPTELDADNVLTGRLIRAHLILVGRTQNWLSRQVGLSINTLNRRLLGYAPLTVPELLAIARILNVEPSAFLTSREHTS